MRNQERIYALLAEANPVPNPNSLPETSVKERSDLRLVEPERDVDPSELGDLVAVHPSRGRRFPARVFVAVATLFLVVSAVVVVASRSDDEISDPVASQDSLDPVEQARAFIDRLDNGEVAEAVDLLSDPVGEVWFISIGSAVGNDQISEYLDFYSAIEATTTLGVCESRVVGPRTVVTCEADHDVEALELLDLRFSTFDMTFDVWADGIRSVGWNQRDSGDFDSAFARSRFLEFSASVLEPNGLLQESGDPVWSYDNGLLVARLIEEFVANS